MFTGMTRPGLTEIFVFGSNLAGRHGKGAAYWAKRAHGAVQGQGEGLHGRSYAIPTKGFAPVNDYYNMPVLPLAVIARHIDKFCTFALEHPELKFMLTPIGCGHARFSPEQIAPMFKRVWGEPNVIFPSEFIKVFTP